MANQEQSNLIKQSLRTNKKTVFISYALAQQRVADEICAVLSNYNVTIIRGNNEINSTTHFETSVQCIRDTDFALLIVSDEYLKDSNCMRDVINLRKERNYKNKMLLVTNNNLINIYLYQGAVIYGNYWKLQLEELGEIIIEDDSLWKERKLRQQIRNEIVTFIREDLTFTYTPPLNELRSKNYFPLIQKIAGVRDNVDVNYNSTSNSSIDLKLKNIVKQKKITVSISYNWNSMNDAKYIYSLLSTYNFIVDMDIYTLQYMDNVSSYLEQIRDSDFTIALITDNFLESRNCLANLLELMKDKNYKKKS